MRLESCCNLVERRRSQHWRTGKTSQSSVQDRRDPDHQENEVELARQPNLSLQSPVGSPGAQQHNNPIARGGLFRPFRATSGTPGQGATPGRERSSPQRGCLLRLCNWLISVHTLVLRPVLERMLYFVVQSFTKDGVSGNQFSLSVTAHSTYFIPPTPS